MALRMTPGMRSKVRKKVRPTATDFLSLASIEITRRCNGRCPYCNLTRGDRDMSFSDFVELLDHLVEEGIEAVALGGGEPTLHTALCELLREAKARGLKTGLTTNCRAPALVLELAEANLIDSFGVSADKGQWLELVRHPRATVNLLLLHCGLRNVLDQALRAMEYGSTRLLLLGYKGGHSPFFPESSEVADAFSILTTLGRKTGITIACDDYTRRRLRLSESCGEGFVRINIDGTRDVCCFPDCEFR
jgi:organic radical activating enzyme